MRLLACLVLCALFLVPCAFAQELTPATELSSGVWVIHEAAPDNVADKGTALLCRPDVFTLCLKDGWFTVHFTMDWGSDEELPGRVILNPFRDGYGGFWAYSDDNPELAVKVIDGCAVNGRYWVYASGLTDRAFLLTITDGHGNTAYYGKFAGYMVSFQDTHSIFACPGY